MTEMNVSKVPVWFWVIGIVAVFLNLFFAFDCYNSLSLNTVYLAEFPEHIEFIRAMPMWPKVAWAGGIACGVLGSLSLLLRKSWASPLYFLAILGLIVTFAYQLIGEGHPEITRGAIVTFTGILVLFVFLALFANRMIAKGVLK